MRIAINAVAVQGGGGQTYLAGLLQALGAAGSSHEFWLILTPRQRSILGLLSPAVRPVVCSSAPRAPWLRVLWEQTALPVLLRRWGADLLFAAFNTAVLLSPVPVVLVAQSVNPYSSLPLRWSPYLRVRFAGLRLLGRLSARVARRVVFVSETSARVIAPRMGIPPSRVRVVPIGWQGSGLLEEACEAQSLATPARYVLTVGDLHPHKNLETLLDAFEQLVEAEGYPGDLVIVGAEQASSRDYGRHLRERHARSKWRHRIHFLGNLTPGTLSRVYRGAELFVFPSLEETFGLPLLEAMGNGVPVAVSDWRLAAGGEEGRTNVGPEICGDAAEFFDPTSARSLVDAMRRALGDRRRRDELVRRGRARARTFSWDRAASALLAVFDEVVAPGGARTREPARRVG